MSETKIERKYEYRKEVNTRDSDAEERLCSEYHDTSLSEDEWHPEHRIRRKIKIL